MASESEVATEFDERVRVALSYHRRTKHQLHRYAASLGFMDWANQPDPFRSFDGAPFVNLPLLADAVAATYDDLYEPGKVRPRSVDQSSIAILFELALGLSAWKQAGSSRWALRCNPSSGNLHPTEGYVIVGDCPGLQAGVYHYLSFQHRLEQRCTLDEPATQRAFGSLPKQCILIGLSSVHWREAWKYGERAFRYCQHDAGHAVATVRYAAAALGWTARLIDHVGDDFIASLLGLDCDDSYSDVHPLDREHPDALLLIGPPPLSFDIEINAPQHATWRGAANRLSPDHVPWEVIDRVATATGKPVSSRDVDIVAESLPAIALDNQSPNAAKLIRQRRSCLSLDGRTSIDRETFYRMLDRLLPRPDVTPWDVVPWRPHLHLGIFVHRVERLEAGLYFFERHEQVHDTIKAACRDELTWTKPEGCPEHLRLFRLGKGDVRELAQKVSCDQDIAADGAFALGMIAEFGDTIRQRGAWWYRRLFWEAGVLGQVLYLEAEAAAIRSTGIGCYFDDVFHDALGLSGDRFQSLYHFTVGAPVEDRRLQTHPPYAHRTKG